MVRIQLVGGPFDGSSIRVLMGTPQNTWQRPEVVEVEGRKQYHLHSYKLGKSKDGLPAYHYEGSAMFA